MKPLLKMYTKTDWCKTEPYRGPVTIAKPIIEKCNHHTVLPYLDQNKDWELYIGILNRWKHVEASAKLSPADHYDEHIGTRLAKTRLMIQYYDIVDQQAALRVADLEKQIRELNALRDIAKRKKKKLRESIHYIYGTIKSDNHA